MAIRILHVVTYMGRGGLETMLMNYYRQIDRTQVQFDFLVHREKKADYDDEIESLGGKIYRLPRLVPWSFTYQKALHGFFEAHPEYQIIHVHQDCLSSVILKAAQECHVPVRIAHSHSSSQDKNLKYPIKMFYKYKISKYATDLFACGEKAGDWMFCGAPYKVVRNAIEVADYLPQSGIRTIMRQQLEFTPDNFVVGHVGRFSYPKNHTYLIEIFAAVRQMNPTAKLLLVGDGDSRSAIQEQVKQAGLQDAVIFTGVRSDVADLMQAMDVFVFPSLYEGLPVTMVEAQAAGLPCVISDQVPLECKLTDEVVRLPLQDTPKQWAKEILRWKDYLRKNNETIISEAGFDIQENARWLQNYYLAQWKEHADGNFNSVYACV